jgi:hypothetical protein
LKRLLVLKFVEDIKLKILPTSVTSRNGDFLMGESIKWRLIVDILITKESRIEEAENQHIWE